MKPIILASSSPRRREILEQVGVSFEIVPSDKEEIITKTKPYDIVKDLASMKANDVLLKVSKPSIIIGADTIVAHNDRIMGKPKDELDAKHMIQELQNDTHEVYTGVSIILSDYNDENILISKELNFYEKTSVSVTAISEDEIDAYVASKEPLDKAGAYAIQGRFATFISKIEGDYFNVVGLPIAKIYEALKREGITINYI
ncbi:Maf family protein [Anaeromicropila herbilytica]|nr:Maf family protein [Anaeromicropila herbilytica]